VSKSRAFRSDTNLGMLGLVQNVPGGEFFLLLVPLFEGLGAVSLQPNHKNNNPWAGGNYSSLFLFFFPFNFYSRPLLPLPTNPKAVGPLCVYHITTTLYSLLQNNKLFSPGFPFGAGGGPRYLPPPLSQKMRFSPFPRSPSPPHLPHSMGESNIALGFPLPFLKVSPGHT